METLKTLTFEITGRIARITLNRPARGNGITMDMPREIAEVIERANLDPAVHVIALSGNGSGFCGGYDLVQSAEDIESAGFGDPLLAGTPMDAAVIARNHDPASVWDPMTDYAMMKRNVNGFMSLFHSDKPVVCKVHGFCVAGPARHGACASSGCGTAGTARSRTHFAARRHRVAG